MEKYLEDIVRKFKKPLPGYRKVANGCMSNKITGNLQGSTFREYGEGCML